MPAATVSVAGRVARVALDRPPLNVIDLGAANDLAAAFESLRARRDLCAVVLEGRGRAFCAGVDVRDHLPDRGEEMLHRFHHACLALAAIEAPTIASVRGVALGGGCELTLMCDLVWAAEGATFGQPEIQLGVFPPLAAVALPRLVSPRLAAEMILTGRVLTAAEAGKAGLVNRVVESETLAGAVEELVGGLSALSPASLRITKQALALSRRRPTPEQVWEAEHYYVEHLLHLPDAIEGLTAFMEKRAPAWATE